MGSVSVTASEWISTGDYVVTTTDSPVMDGKRKVTTLETSTNFRVSDVNETWLCVEQEVDGENISGWVKKDDVLKLDKDHYAVAATQDNLTRNQWQTLKLPRGESYVIKYVSTLPIDVFVISEEGKLALQSMSENGSGRVSTKYSRLSESSGTFTWSPPDDDRYYVVMDNTSFPDKGTNSRRKIYYSLAYCIADPKPEEPRDGKGLIVGQAILRFDDYEGRDGRYRDPYKVAVDISENEDDDTADTVEVQTDSNGYFFLTNVDPSKRYCVSKIVNDDIEAPVSVVMSFTFGEEDGGYAPVQDAGKVSLVVRSNGKIGTTIINTDSIFRSKEDGGATLRPGVQSPLERHKWFLNKFPDSDWSDHVADDRDETYREREEKRKRKTEKEQEE